MAQSSDMISAVNGVQDMEELEGRKHDSRVYKVVLTGGLFDFYVQNSCYTVLEPYGKTFAQPLFCAIASIPLRCLFSLH